MKALLAGVALLLVGCNEPPKCDTFHPHTTLTSEHLSRVSDAFVKWSSLSGRAPKWDASPSDDVTCSVRVVADGSPEYQSLKSEVGSDFVGVWHEKDGSIVLVPTRIEGVASLEELDSQTEATVLHELGHVIGLRHVAHEGSVMSATGPGVLEFSPDDVAECVSVGCR